MWSFMGFERPEKGDPTNFTVVRRPEEMVSSGPPMVRYK